MFYQLITNDLLIECLLLSLPVVYQSFPCKPHPFCYIVHIVAIVTNYFNWYSQLK